MKHVKTTCEYTARNNLNIIEHLKACAKQKDLVQGSRLHAYIWKHNLLQKNFYIGSALVNMYAKCGAFAKAQQLLSELPVRDVVTWTALIAGYAQLGHSEEALECFDNMQHDGHFPNAATFTCVLKACGSIRAAAMGQEMHNIIVRLGMLEKDIVLGNALMDMYVQCGALANAQHVVNGLPVQDAATWNILIAGYVQHGRGKEALKFFNNMQWEGHSPDAVTFIWVLKACGIIQAVTMGEKIHEKIVSLGMLERHVVLASTIVDMYVQCGALDKAWQLLKELPVKNVVTWNTLIAGYVQHGQGKEALKCFDNMQHEGLSPDTVTFIFALKACGNMGAAVKGEQIHGRIVNLGILEKDIALGGALVDMYAKAGALAKAQVVLSELPVHDVAMCNSLIAGYAQNGLGKEALKYFNSMQHEGYFPDIVTFIGVLKACGSIRVAAEAEKIHGTIVQLNMLGKNIMIGSNLVAMYAKCGALSKAQEVLDELPVRNVVTWTSLIAGYSEQGQSEDALKCFDTMESEGHCPDAITFIFALKACGNMVAATKGEQIHDKIVQLGMLRSNLVLRNVLVDMYAKCGALVKAEKVLKEYPVQDVVTWNALIGGYALQGEGEKGLSSFEQMQSKCIRPNSTTLACVLNACSNSGLVDQGEMYFFRVSGKYGITLDMEHYCCMVDLFGRAGRIKKAFIVIEEMPIMDYLPIWLALLGACCKCVDLKVGKWAFHHAFHLDNSDSAAYVCMGNICTATGMQKGADKTEPVEGANEAQTECCQCTDVAGKLVFL